MGAFLTSVRLRALVATVTLLLLAGPALARQASDTLPVLTGPVNDFANVIDGPSARELENLSRALQAATGDALVVATIDTAASRGDIQAYANELFQNGGRGLGAKGQDNGLLILVAVRDRRAWIEVGYGLEGIITDGFAGQTSREEMSPRFREGHYGAGLLGAMRRLGARIAEARGVSLDQLPIPARSARRVRESSGGGRTLFIMATIIIFLIIANSRSGGRRGRRAYWGGGPWSGWGGGGYGGTFGGGGGFSGGGFGGFGGGSSGGGGGGSSW